MARTDPPAWRASATEPDTLVPDEGPPGRASKEKAARAARLRHSAESWVRLLSAPARRLPRLELNDVEISTGNGDDSLIGGLRIARLDLHPVADGIQFSTAGSLQFEREVSFNAAFTYDRVDRIRGWARVPDHGFDPPSYGSLLTTVEGTLRQDYHKGLVTIGEGTRVTMANSHSGLTAGLRVAARAFTSPCARKA